MAFVSFTTNYGTDHTVVGQPLPLARSISRRRFPDQRTLKGYGIHKGQYEFSLDNVVPELIAVAERYLCN
jgi:hypothetical protein